MLYGLRVTGRGVATKATAGEVQDLKMRMIPNTFTQRGVPVVDPRLVPAPVSPLESG